MRAHPRAGWKRGTRENALFFFEMLDKSQLWPYTIFNLRETPIGALVTSTQNQFFFASNEFEAFFYAILAAIDRALKAVV